MQIEDNAASDFKSIIEEYSLVNKELTAINARAKEIRGSKKSIEETVISFMKLNKIDQAQLPNGSKITRKVSKRTSPLTKDIIIEVLKTKIDAADAEQLVQQMFAKRKVSESETISLTKGKRSAADATLDDDDDDDDEAFV